MTLLGSSVINCPYCGEAIELVIDPSVAEQEYIEDCEVCCRPISLIVTIDTDQQLHVVPRHENE